MTILITGLGYIGAQLATDLLAAGEAVVALENFFCTSPRQVAALSGLPGLTVIRGSINQPETLRRAFAAGPVRAVVHLAAQPSAHPNAASPRYTELTNLVGARYVLEAAVDAGGVVVLGSSFKVYGDQLPAVVSEGQPYGPVGDLAHLSKIYGEKLAEMLSGTRGLRCVAVRLGITYGLSPIMKTDPRFMTVPNRFAQLLAQRQPLTVHATAIRPAGFIHVADASRALRAALSLERPEAYRAVNAVSECLSVSQVAELARDAAQSRGLQARITGPSGGPPRAVQAVSSLPTEPRHHLADSMGEIVDYFLGLEADPGARERQPNTSLFS